ncbi:MAG: hypothetical protein RR412_02200 [Burkholderiaceae bacterium]
MIERGSGCINLIGSSSGLVGRAEHVNLAVGQFGLRALSQGLARARWSAGIHIAHGVVDADIHEPGRLPDGDPKADPAPIAELIAAIHRQPRSAWSREVDVRPFDEKFWQHC